MIHADTQRQADSGHCSPHAHDKLRHVLLIPALTLLAVCLTLAACDDSEPSGPMPQDDTTSHNFEWFTDTLGAELSSVNDVYCVSENDAWAVGQFYYRDPETGQQDRSRDANAAHWDGEKWTMHRIAGRAYELFAVHVLSSDDIWANTFNWNGYRWVPYNVTGISGGTRKIWGDRPDNVYFAGDRGSLMHWDGAAFTQLDGGTTASYCDVWGWKDTMYVAVSDYDQQSGRRGYLLRYEKGAFQRREMFDYKEQIAVWGMHGTWYSGGVSSLYRKTGGEWKVVLHPDNHITGIRGTALNNVYFFVQRGTIIHYNGSTFNTIRATVPSRYIYTGSISAAGSMVLACGQTGRNALVLRGYQRTKE